MYVNGAKPLAFLTNTWSAFETTGLEIKKSKQKQNRTKKKQREGGREREQPAFELRKKSTLAGRAARRNKNETKHWVLWLVQQFVSSFETCTVCIWL